MKTWKMLALAGTFFICGGGIAATVSDSVGEAQLRLHTGVLSGEAGEYVYDAYGNDTGIPGYKLSELQWEIDPVTMIGVGFSIAPLPELRLSLDYWKNASDGDATMDDYDWLYIGYDWSHWSHHPDTRAREVTRLDLRGDYTFYRDPASPTAVSVLFGYQRDYLDWVANGGTGIYSVDAYRDTRVVFPDRPVIAYEQTYDTPYLGLGLETGTRAAGYDISLTAGLRYSMWVSGEDKDIHYLRNLKFEEEGSGGKWLGLDLGMAIALNKQLALQFGYSHQEYDEIKASTLVTDLSSGQTYYYGGDAAGLDYTSKMFSLGIGYRF